MTDVVNDGRTEHLSDRSTAELMKLAADQISHLVRDELRLAQVEITQKGKRAGLGVGMFGAAGLVALYGAAGLLAALVLLLALVMPAWLAALLGAGGVLGGARGLAEPRRGAVEQAAPPGTA